MHKSNAPTKLTVAFASGSGAGPVNAVPLTPGATPGTASYQTGFTSVNMEPIASGGVPPFGADFNGVFKNATTAQIWQQCGYICPYDSDFASNANIGGYPAQSVLMMGAGNGLWVNNTDNNSTNPDATGSAGWIGLPAVGAYTITTTGGTTTPDPSVLGVTTLIVSGALTSNATIVLPLAAGSRWIVANNTTGSFTLTVQGTSGAGASIAQGAALTVFTDGTDYFAASANISGQYLPINGTAVAATKLATARNFSITGLATAAAVGFDGTGNVVFNVTALNVAGALGYTPANDSQVVHIAGTETITGTKTFSGTVTTGTIVATSNAIIGGAQFAVVSPSASGGQVLFRPNGQGSSSGQCSVSSAGAFTCATFNASASDRRLKKHIRKVKPRPLHRQLQFVSFELRENGWVGLGEVAQRVLPLAPEHVGEFEKDGKNYYSLNYAGMAYEQAVWASREVDRLTLRVAKLEHALAKAKIEPRKRGFCQRLLEIIW